MMRKQYSAAFKARVVQELLKEEKTLAQIASEYEVHPTQLKNWRAVALEGLPGLFEKQESTTDLKRAHEQQLSELYAEIGKLSTQVSWLKKKKVTTLRRADRAALVERAEGELPLSLPADLLSLSRASLYYQPRPPTTEEVQLKHRIDEVYTQYPFYGARKIAAQLQREGMSINRKTVGRYMNEMGIAAIFPGPNLSKRNQREGVYPYLLRHITSASPNHIWGIDSTSIRLQAGWMYLVAILDWYWRYVVSWELDHTLELPFVLTAVQRALGQAVPLICNSDQGSHFTSPQYCQLLQAANVQISMDGKGRALDNIFTESLWRTVKDEEVYMHDYPSPREARQSLTRYFAFYKHERPHQALDYQSPADIYFRKAAAAGV
jgi:putative transposase